MIIVKIYLGISLEFLWAVWCQFSFRSFFFFCSYFFLRSIGSFQCLVRVNYRVLICCTGHFRVPSLFILASSVCKSLQHLISTLTQGGEIGHLFRLTCSVVLWGEGNTADKYHWHVWGVLAVYGIHWVCPS